MYFYFSHICFIHLDNLLCTFTVAKFEVFWGLLVDFCDIFSFGAVRKLNEGARSIRRAKRMGDRRYCKKNIDLDKSQNPIRPNYEGFQACSDPHHDQARQINAQTQ